MLGVALFFIGAVLIVNGVGLTGRIEARDSAPFNLLVGLLALAINLLGLYRASGAMDYFAVGGGLLFAFTYLYLAAPMRSRAWSTLFSIPILKASMPISDIRVISMWLLWASLWFFFYLALGLGKKLPFLGIYTAVIGIVTCWLPGLLMMMGRW